MNKKGLLASILLLFILPFPVLAQERGFLPKCEKTIYRVESPPPTAFDCNASVGSGGGKCVYAEDYQESYGQITGFGVNRNCEITDFIQLFINLADWGLSILGAIAVMFFLWGGFDMIIAGGRQTYIDGGKKKMLGSIYGVLIVLVAWLFVGFYVGALAGNWDGVIFPNEDAKYQRLWFGNYNSCKDTFKTKCSALSNEGIGIGCGDPKAQNFGPIAQLQTKLSDGYCYIAAGSISGKVDGCYDQDTADAVRQFQSDNKLTPTGTVNINTYNSIMGGGICGPQADATPITTGCCIPKGYYPTDWLPCIEALDKNMCENSLHYDGHEYYWQYGSCTSTDCGDSIVPN
ncbi:MAG: peptidoglycan-binding protein [Patescibacteria group bacterium]